MIFKEYFQSITRCPAGSRRRTVKRNIWIVTALAFAATSCEPNEISFFIQHVKALPDAPDCTVSISDGWISSVTVDLALAPALENDFQVKNQLVAREDYDNLRAESNTILTEGYEVSVALAATNESVGSARYIIEHSIPPQSEELLTAYTLPGSVSADLAARYNCLSFNETNYDAGDLGPNGAEDINGRAVPRSLGSAYATVRFFGHTVGQVDVETQEFTFQVDLCCGCSINWLNCGKPCERYCEEPDDQKMCIVGVVDGPNKYDCREVYYDPYATWQPLGSDVCEDDDGSARACNCDADCK